MTYTLTETCCGSSALTLHLLGAKKSLMPYQGSKWRYRKALQEIAEAEPIEELGSAWKTKRISSAPTMGCSFKSKREEWVTYRGIRL